MTTLHEGSPRARRRSGPSSSPTFDQEALSPRAVCTHAAKISDKSASTDSQILVGQLCIAACALLWGTYAPALRLAYNSPLPPDPAVVTAIRAMIQAAVLYTLLQLQTNDQGKLADDHGGADGEEMSAQGQSGDKLDASQPLAFARRLLNTTSGSFWIMGAELGFWNFAATVAQAEGLEFTSATRGSFLMSVTALLTPALAILAGEATTRSTIIASVLAVFGVGLIVLDDTAGVPGVSPTYQMIGDVAVLVSACFYSLLTVRIGRYARQAAPVRLASSKSTALAAIALASLGVLAVKRGLSGEGVSSLWGNPFDLVALGAIGWAALGPGASAAFLQSKGQGVVPASQTQVVGLA
ncbi:hypothetical protein WJX84_007270 [Apatococcus fuscideae]|uniref:EamA domain-containing protein n=1 Tax=Apatococcus fuscideae TaxID=2026836 RepID=A0AAW1SQ91_9CHLO